MNIKVHVHARSKKPRIEKIGDVLYIYVSALPVEGQANQAVTETLVEYLGVAKSKIKLIRGAKSKMKVFSII